MSKELLHFELSGDLSMPSLAALVGFERSEDPVAMVIRKERRPWVIQSVHMGLLFGIERWSPPVDLALAC